MSVVRLRIAGFGILLTLTSASSFGVVKPGADGTQSPASDPGAAEEPSETSRIKLDIPVSWQVTRARFMASGSSTQTESFRETWAFIMRPDGSVYLASSRAEVPIYRAGALKNGPIIPSAVVLTEVDFGRLTGLLPPTIDPSAALQPGQRGRLVTLVMNRAGRSGNDFVLNFTEEDHFAIHFDIGTPPTTY